MERQQHQQQARGASARTASADAPVIIVGSGIAGLVCALELTRAGRTVRVLERELDVGGRARSHIMEGHVIDRGFQVLFTAYPVLGSYLDLPALVLRHFLPAARIALDGRSSLLGDALQEPGLLLDTVLAGLLPTTDKLRLLALRHLARSLTVDECFAQRYASISTRDFLAERGFSARAVSRFFAPFYGGILLDRSLGTSAAVLLFTFKMLAEGRAAVPATGMGAIAGQLAARLPADCVQTSVSVAAVQVDLDGRAVGVRLDDGSTMAASDVVLATDPPAAARLAATAGSVRREPVAAGLPCTTAYFTAARAPLAGAALWLNAEPRATVSHAVTLTEVAPEYAPPGRHLLAATAVGEAAELPDEDLIARAIADVRAMRGTHSARDGPMPQLVPLTIVRVPYAQYAQAPGYREHRPTIALPGVPGLWLASETLHSSSLEGAARGGRAAAQALLGASTERAHA